MSGVVMPAWVTRENVKRAMAEVAPLRLVLNSELYWKGDPHKAGSAFGYHFLREKLECHHVIEVRHNLLRKATRRRCTDCQREAEKLVKKEGENDGNIDK